MAPFSHLFGTPWTGQVYRYVYIQLFFHLGALSRTSAQISKRKGDLEKQAGKHAQLWLLLPTSRPRVEPALNNLSKQTDRQTKKERKKERKKQTDKQTNKQTIQQSKNQKNKKSNKKSSNHQFLVFHCFNFTQWRILLEFLMIFPVPGVT